MDFKISKILLIRLTQDQTGNELSDTPDYPTVPKRTYIFTGNVLLLLIFFGCTTNKKFPVGCLLHVLIHKHHGYILFSCIFIAEEIHGGGNRGSEDAKRLL
jgi:hypothetical protein